MHRAVDCVSTRTNDYAAIYAASPDSLVSRHNHPTLLFLRPSSSLLFRQSLKSTGLPQATKIANSITSTTPLTIMIVFKSDSLNVVVEAAMAVVAGWLG